MPRAKIIDRPCICCVTTKLSCQDFSRLTKIVETEKTNLSEIVRKAVLELLAISKS